MKNTRKTIAILLISLLSIGNTYATGFPDEPMVIYGNISGVNNGITMEIYDENNTLLKSVVISDGKYGTDKTFDVNNKISLNTYTGVLKFSISGYTYIKTTKGGTTTCESSTTFQKGNICEYNLDFNKIVIVAPTASSGGGGGGGGSSAGTSYNMDLKNETLYDSKDYVAPLKTVTKKTITKVIKKSENVKRNEEGKIIIKGKDYIKNIRMFDSNKKTTRKVFGHKVLNIKGDDLYNKKITTYTKKIHNNIKLDSIRKSIINSMDKMTITYGILTDSNLDENLKDTYKAKLVEDKEYFDLKLKKLIRKDLIIRYTLKKRKLRNK